MLKVKILASRIVEGSDNEKKYVAYTVQVGQNSVYRVSDEDPDAVHVERRYTHFLDLYNGLKKEYPAELAGFSFPRKIVVGNFEPNLIKDRCEAFEQLLSLITNVWRLRESAAAVAFFHNVELNEARHLLKEGEYEMAFVILEMNFKLLNKLYMDRSRVVLTALCRLVGCAARAPRLAEVAERWALLALRRYEGVSDADLLTAYIPLLHACAAIWTTLDRDKEMLLSELESLRKRGMKTEQVPTLLEAVDNLDNTV